MSRPLPIAILLLAQACTVTPTDRARVTDVPKPAATEAPTAQTEGPERGAKTSVHYMGSSALSGGGSNGGNGAAISAAVAATLIMVDAVLSTLGRGDAEQGRKQTPGTPAPAK